MLGKKVNFKLGAAMSLGLLAVVYWAAGFSFLKVETGPGKTPAETDIVINFILPVHRVDLSSKITIEPENPYTRVDFKFTWLNSRTVILCLKPDGKPQGQLLKFRIEGIQTVFPTFRKRVSGQVRMPAELNLVSGNSLQKISSRGPVPVNFNTPIDPQTIQESIDLPLPGKLEPVQFSFRGKTYTDYSQWLYYPARPFKNSRDYIITVNPGLRSSGGDTLEAAQKISFTTVKKPQVVKTVPANNDNRVRLYGPAEFFLDTGISSAAVRVTDSDGNLEMPGTTSIQGNRVIFRPEYAYLPGKGYKAELQAKSEEQEPIGKYLLSFTTLEMGKRFWVDVKLGDLHTVRVYQGNKLLRHMPASGGKSETPTPTGYFYTQDRGYSFWSPRFGEGATYWVRLVGQILVHSIPRDSRWSVKDDEHAKLGLPASHGCIRLEDNDARWFYENIPRGTLVIIHQ